MKVGSPVLTSLQKPMTAFGVPIKAALLVLGMALVVFVLFVWIGSALLGFFLLLLLSVLGFAFLWRVNKSDWHWENKTFFGNNFFKGKETRVLKAGRKPSLFNKTESN